ncbi:MAG: hypothetical protein ACOCQ4_00620 [bacterium]
MRFHIYLIFILFIFTISCKNNSSETKVPLGPAPLDTTERKIGKAIFYLENSGSMFGYVNGFTEYVDVVSELAEKPEFAEHQTPREFNFVNGGQNLKVTNIGQSPASLKDKLNVNGFNCGDVSKSNLNSMFQLALSRAKNDTISILISDAIYDIGKPQAPMNALSTEGRETRSRFIERLNEGDLQTIIIKLNSQFDGDYFPVTGGSVDLSQDRPYYVWIFGETELLNQYFTDDYIKSLKGFTDIARFLKLSELEVPYQATAHKKVGDFRFDSRDKNKLINVKTVGRGEGFQFTFAVNYSELPFSDSYLTSTSNYTCNNSNFSIRNVSSIGDVKLFGLDFEPTHIVTIGTEKSPHCKLEISLLNKVPNWIENTNSDDESNIIGDTTHTFGFKFLTNAISEAYQYKNKESNIVTFKFELIK